MTFYAKCSSAGLWYGVTLPDWSSNIAGTITTGNNAWTKYSLYFNSGSYISLLIRFTDVGIGTQYIDDIDVRTNGNLVANPGFETGSSDPWTLGSGYSIISTDKNSGIYSVNLIGTGDGSNMYQTIQVIPYTNYTMTFYAKCGSTGLWYGITTTDWSTNIVSGTSKANNIWTKYILSFNSGNNSSLFVRFSDLGGTYYIDDIDIR